MERLFIECAIRAALLVAGTAIVLLLLRVKDAAARHKVWTGVVLVMLLLPAWTAWGPKATVRVLPPLPEEAPFTLPVPAIRNAPPDFSIVEREPSASPAPVAPAPRWTWQTTLLGIYLLDVAALLLRLAIGVARAQQLIRRANLRDGRLASSDCSAPVTVGWLRPRVVLPEEWSEWPQAKLDAVLTHESEHARRRDPLIQGLALLNRAAFWFHPAAWWLEHRIATLAEEACDDVVLSRGHSPSDYSEYLMDMARAISRSGGRVNMAGVAMPGSSLPHRIKRIIEGVQVPTTSRMRMACVAVACTITCTAFASGSLDRALTADPMRSPQQQANGLPSPGAELPKFDSVSIKPRTFGPDNWNHSDREKGSVSATFTLRHLLWSAYPLRQPSNTYTLIRGNPSPIPTPGSLAVIRGAPDWIDSARFDIEATTNSKLGPDQWRLMFQSLLADHFKLTAHYETDVVPTYGLVLSEPGRLGPQLRHHVSDGSGLSLDGSCWDPAVDQPPSSVTGRPTVPYCGGYRIERCDDFPGGCFARNQAMEQLAANLTGLVDRPVYDQTGLSGRVDYDMVIDSRKPRGDRSTQLDYSKVSAALQEQLGLRLVPMNGPIEYLVIDHVEMPSVDQSAQAQARSSGGASLALKPAARKLPAAAAQSSVTVPTLREAPRPLNLKAFGDSKRIFEIAAENTNLTVTFDPNFTSRIITLAVTDVTLEQLLDAIALESKASWKPVTNTSILVAPTQRAQVDPSQVIDSIIFDGNRRIPSQMLQSRISIRIGDYYSDEALRRDHMALWNSQYFDDIRLEVKESPNRPNAVVVMFHLKERPTIASLDYVGFTSVTKEEILERFRKEQLNVTVESLLDLVKVRRAEDALKTLLAEHGRPSAVVRGGVAIVPATNRVRLVFTATEKPIAAAQEPSARSVPSSQVILEPPTKNLSPEEAKARVISHVLPAAQDGAGIVDIGLGISPGGEIRFVTVYRGAPALVKPALDAIRQFKFRALAGGDTSVIEQIRLLVRFHANGTIDVLAVRSFGRDSFGDQGAPPNSPDVPYATISG